MPIDPADHLRLVYRYVRRHDPPTPNEEDRLQDAFEGLVRAAQSYDPEKGAFSTHAHHSIRACAGRGRQRLGSIGRFGSARRNSVLYAHAAKVTRPGEVISWAWAEDLWQGPLTEAEYATVAAMRQVVGWWRRRWRAGGRKGECGQEGKMRKLLQARADAVRGC